ncbi:MAG TPA: hypothetical protein VIX19_02515 [Terriglobales bacterium]
MRDQKSAVRNGKGPVLLSVFCFLLSSLCFLSSAFGQGFDAYGGSLDLQCGPPLASQNVPTTAITSIVQNAGSPANIVVSFAANPGFAVNNAVLVTGVTDSFYNTPLPGGINPPGPNGEVIWYVNAVTSTSATLTSYGTAAHAASSGGTITKAVFYSYKDANRRWWFCSPLGNYFHEESLYGSAGASTHTGADYQGVTLWSLVQNKYTQGSSTWAGSTNDQTNFYYWLARRVLSWLFNSYAETTPPAMQAADYSTGAGGWNTADGYPPREARVPWMEGSNTLLVLSGGYNVKGFGFEGTKNNFSLVKFGTYSGFQRGQADFFSATFPYWFSAATGALSQSLLFGKYAEYRIGFFADESDEGGGETLGTDFGSLVSSGEGTGHLAYDSNTTDKNDAHYGYLTAIDAPVESAGYSGALPKGIAPDQAYYDPLYHVKQEWANWLQGHGSTLVTANYSLIAGSGSSCTGSAGSYSCILSVGNNNFRTGQQVQVIQADPEGFNTEVPGQFYTITSTGANSITFTYPGSTPWQYGGIVYVAWGSEDSTIQSVSGSPSACTINFSGPNPFVTNDLLSIMGGNPSGFNTAPGQPVTVSSYTSTSITVATNSCTWTSGGTVGAGMGYTSISQLNSDWTNGSVVPGYDSFYSDASVPVIDTLCAGTWNGTNSSCSQTLSHTTNLTPYSFRVYLTPPSQSGAAFLGGDDARGPRATTPNTTGAFRGNVYGSGTEFPSWSASPALGGYYGNRRITDSNGKVEFPLIGGTPNSSHPTWSSGFGATTADNTITWVNLAASSAGSVFNNTGETGASCSSSTQSCVDYSDGQMTVIFTYPPVSGASVSMRYTTGGWTLGKGVLDEDGTCPSKTTTCWLPTGASQWTLAGLPARMVTAFSGFYFHAFKNDFSVVKREYNTAYPGLIWTPMTIGAYDTPPHKEILELCAVYCDFLGLAKIPAQDNPNSDSQNRIDFVAAYAGDKPWTNFLGSTAWADSYSSGSSFFAAGTGAVDFPTQAARGAGEISWVNTLLNAQVSSGCTTYVPSCNLAGTYPIAGDEWWELYDLSASYSDGLIDPRDDVYDGMAATTNAGTDSFGFPTGCFLNKSAPATASWCEQISYGNFLSGVLQANRIWLNYVQRKQRAAGRPGGLTQ